MIGNVQDFIAYAGARGVVIDPAQAPILLVKATDLLNTFCWVGQPVDPAQEDSWPRVGYDGSPIVNDAKQPIEISPGVYLTVSNIPAKIQFAAFRLGMEASAGVDLMPTVAGKQTLKETVVGAVSVEYDKDSIGAAPYFPWLDSFISAYILCEDTGINFAVGRA